MRETHNYVHICTHTNIYPYIHLATPGTDNSMSVTVSVTYARKTHVHTYIHTHIYIHTNL